VRVHVVRPGFVTTKMTAGLPPAPFSTDPEVVAEAIAGVVGARSNRVVYVPGKLRLVFLVMRNLPAPLWRRVAGER
jgi:decaprenylphospho-beta-D-erythro-pentofuranosid-2-ulose 2-reductase